LPMASTATNMGMKLNRYGCNRFNIVSKLYY
jgi:hypothetical protein